MKYKGRVTLEEALGRVPGPDGERYVTMLERGTLRVEMYAPRGEDAQTPHDQDEVYVVMQGRGEFINGETRHPFRSGDVLFVPAGVEHRFDTFSEDLTVWVIFYGPRGGEPVA